MTPLLADNFGNGLLNYFPLMVTDPNPMHGGDAQPNVSESRSLSRRPGCRPQGYVLPYVATMHSPAYSDENQGALKQDWPRIPFRHQGRPAGLGSARARTCRTPRSGRSVSKSAKCLKSIAPITASEGALDPDAGDLELTAGWGHAGRPA